jgi:predicted transposase/invertase (TIGR01784 family)
MKTDSIFYRLFQTFPGIFFELINHQAAEANAYEFASVELKQTAFRIDGVFLPVANQQNLPIYFLEVQFQKDPEFYARFFSEIFLYLRLYAPTKPWQGVVVFAKRSLEPIKVVPYQVLLVSPQVTRLYLDELGDAAAQSLGIGIIKLVIETKKRTPTVVDKARQELLDEAVQRQVLDLIETIVLYKLPNINRQELARMFGLNELKHTRYYQEVREEITEEITQQVTEEVRQEVRQETTLELLNRQLLRRVGAVNPQLQERINQLSVAQLNDLAEALLDFANQDDLTNWLSSV